MTFSHTYINIQRKSNYKIDLRSTTEETRITHKMYKIAWPKAQQISDKKHNKFHIS
jgi:hypothetical protein